MDSSSTKDMDSLVISGDTLAAEGSSGLAGDPVLDVLLSDSTREELDGWAVTLGLERYFVVVAILMGSNGLCSIWNLD